MDEFLKHCFPSLKKFKKEKLPGDGGHRSYTRIRADEQTFILMSCGEKDPSLKLFIQIQKRLEPFVRVPKIFQMDFEKGWLLMEDLGNQTLEQFYFEMGFDLSQTFYHQALKQLIKLQSQIPPLKTDSYFKKDFFLEENEMAIHHLQLYINNSHKTLPALFNERSSRDFKKDMEKVLSFFKAEDYVYCHRDYHSRNLMLKAREVVVIDFQDAGLGPWYYDLTSLLYDSYVRMNSSQKNRLLSFYFENLPPSLKNKARSLSHLEKMSKLQFLQRGFKACGRFAAFKNENQKSTHLKYILPTLKLLGKTAEEMAFPGMSQYLHKMIEGLEKQKFN